MMLDGVTLGTKVFMRTEKLKQLLESAEAVGVPRVIVADDGRTADREELYNRVYEFDLQVLDLEYDSGLGHGRKQIVAETQTEHLLFADTDHRLPQNVGIAKRLLKADGSIGGVGGLLIEETEDDTSIEGMYHDLTERGSTLLRTIKRGKSVEWVDGIPFVPYEFIPFPTLFRTECFETYDWDPEYVISREHLDFYVGQRESKWRFGLCPQLSFYHDQRSDEATPAYEGERWSSKKRGDSAEYFLSKWGYTSVQNEGTLLDRSGRSGPVRMAINNRIPRRIRLALGLSNY